MCNPGGDIGYKDLELEVNGEGNLYVRSDNCIHSSGGKPLNL